MQAVIEQNVKPDRYLTRTLRGCVNRELRYSENLNLNRDPTHMTMLFGMRRASTTAVHFATCHKSGFVGDTSALAGVAMAMA